MFFEDTRIEPTVVKNLENVQGDERDVMLFFNRLRPGPNRATAAELWSPQSRGWRTTSERCCDSCATELVVYCSFRADQLNPDKTKHIGVRHLKTFLDYADRGPIALFAQDRGSVGSFESPFEEAVAAQLVKRGWQAVPQIGVSAFRIDLGIVNPDKPGSYLAGIECDGATYHRSASARDRDKIRDRCCDIWAGRSCVSGPRTGGRMQIPPSNVCTPH